MGERTTGLGYVPAIDGLRAVAVLAVVVFHLWPDALPGGFTGVDIFFVISGFVVTASVAGRRFETLGAMLAWFYARRLVRILPALAAMLLVTMVATAMLVPPSWLSRTIPDTGLAAVFGLSNLVLAFDTDSYFGPQAAFNPFTHSWSLGVEEQFYLLFPLLLFRQRGAAAHPVRLVLWLSLASLVPAAVLGQLRGSLAFYLLPARFWELGAGMLLWLTAERWRPSLASAAPAVRAMLAVASLLLVAAGLALPHSDGFPFPHALLPVAGTAGLIALAVAAPALPIARLLAAPVPVAIGLLSYSLYLWHWPMLVLFRWTAGLHTLPLQLLALGLSAALAAVSYLLLERPLRASPRLAALPRRRVALGGIAAMAMTGAAGFVILQAQPGLALGVTRDHAAWYADERTPLDPARTRCAVAAEGERIERGRITAYRPSGCPAGRFTVYALGDSHNLAYVPAYRQLAAELGVPVVVASRAGCPLVKLHQPPLARCRAWQAALIAWVETRARPGDVIFLPGLRLTRRTNQFEGDGDAVAPDAERVPAAAMADARAVLRAFAGTGAGMVFEAPKPLFASPAFRCADRFNRANPICAGGLSIARDVIERQRAPVLGAMRTLAGELPALHVWDPLPRLCDPAACRAIVDGRPRFFDGDHLSGHGSALLYPDLRAAILAAARRPGLTP